MKKKQAKKLLLSRETLQALTSSDCQKVVGGHPLPSSQSNNECPACN